ncbi:MAG: prepilin-type N-terminal cleavage/methylation domain-containing protein [Candidatus Velthaea sp.]
MALGGVMAGARAQRGFTLIEIVIAAGLFAVVTLVLFELMRQLHTVTARYQVQHAGVAALAQFGDRLRSEALGAIAIAVSSNACDEVEFVSQDASGYHFWSYRFVAAAGTLAGSIVRTTGSAPIAPCVASADSATVAGGVQTMTAAAFTLAQIAGHVDPLGGAPDTPFVQTAAAQSPDLAVAVDLHVQDSNGDDFSSGNGMVEITVASAVATMAFDIAPGVRPSGYQKVLTYACALRSGCGPGMPAPQFLSGADVAQCAVAAAVVIDANAVPAALDQAACDVGDGMSGLCTFVQSWLAYGFEDFTYGSPAAAATRTYRYYWQTVTGPYAPDLADRFAPGKPPVAPAFAHDADAVSAVHASDPSLVQFEQSCRAIGTSNAIYENG